MSIDYILFSIILLLVMALLYRKEKYNLSTYGLLYVYLLIVFFLSLFPIDRTQSVVPIQTVMENNVNLIPLSNGSGIIKGLDLSLYVMDAILFMPFGALLPLVSKKEITVSKVFRDSLLLSFSIELSQFVITYLGWANRIIDVNDLIFNTLGSVFIFLFVCMIKNILMKSQNHQEDIE